MKIFSFFLPQFHEIPENDRWWGKGFTEWTNVKKAAPLYQGHSQPKHPLNDNYYNLLDKKTVVFQTNLMNSYGIDGMIYYHYYFRGKLLLEKPAENLLKWRDIQQPFFFCWANHEWNRSWRGSRELLQEMSYGGTDDWEKHIQYLIPFFKDERYIKVNNKPLFMIYNTTFDEKCKIIEYFDARLKDYGFDGISIIENQNDLSELEYNSKKLSSKTEYVFLREPSIQLHDFQHSRNIVQKVFNKIHVELAKRNLVKKPIIYNGSVLIENKIKKEIVRKDVINGLWFEWDNTPRHGRRGYIITPYTKEAFVKYMNIIKDSEFLFINAWNEWCEGMVLEPTREEGYKYLEWIREWKTNNKENYKYNNRDDIL